MGTAVKFPEGDVEEEIPMEDNKLNPTDLIDRMDNPTESLRRLFSKEQRQAYLEQIE